MEKHEDDAHIEKLELDAIQNLAAQLYTNQPENITIPNDYTPTPATPQENLFDDYPNDLKRAILPDDLITDIYNYMKTNNIEDFSTAINQLINKALKQ